MDNLFFVFLIFSFLFFILSLTKLLISKIKKKNTTKKYIKFSIYSLTSLFFSFIGFTLSIPDTQSDNTTYKATIESTSIIDSNIIQSESEKEKLIKSSNREIEVWEETSTSSNIQGSNEVSIIESSSIPFTIESSYPLFSNDAKNSSDFQQPKQTLKNFSIFETLDIEGRYSDSDKDGKSFIAIGVGIDNTNLDISLSAQTIEISLDSFREQNRLKGITLFQSKKLLFTNNELRVGKMNQEVVTYIDSVEENSKKSFELLDGYYYYVALDIGGMYDLSESGYIYYHK